MRSILVRAVSRVLSALEAKAGYTDVHVARKLPALAGPAGLAMCSYQGLSLAKVRAGVRMCVHACRGRFVRDEAGMRVRCRS